MKDSVDIHEMLMKTLMINVADAKECLRIAEECGDEELKKRAEDDLKRWQERLVKLQAEDH